MPIRRVFMFALAAALWSLICLPVTASAQSNHQSHEAGYYLQDYGDDFDLATCQQGCRSRYGVDPYFLQWSGGSNPIYMYSSCIYECNRKFWKEYDRQMKELEDTKIP